MRFLSVQTLFSSLTDKNLENTLHIQKTCKENGFFFAY